ncbi:hypothetical protein [Candidiatus Paracoxiella cheracis]|uniref:hypothetical protein n=1 Tax=Candidiatus Paracoxiella cheracis TaxID=3405120 RepID=UPI003BF4C58E
MTARKDFLQSLTLGKKSEPTAEYAPSLRSPWRASKALLFSACPIFSIALLDFSLGNSSLEKYTVNHSASKFTIMSGSSLSCSSKFFCFFSFLSLSNPLVITSRFAK